MKRILVGLDDSPDSRAAAELAATLARATSASLELVFVIEPGPARIPLQLSGGEEFQREQRERGGQILARVAARLESGAVTRIEQGSPADVLCTLARDAEVTMVVAGYRGHHLLSGLLGSASERLVRTCSKPVVIVHSPRADSVAAAKSGRQG